MGFKKIVWNYENKTELKQQLNTYFLKIITILHKETLLSEIESFVDSAARRLKVCLYRTATAAYDRDRGLAALD